MRLNLHNYNIFFFYNIMTSIASVSLNNIETQWRCGLIVGKGIHHVTVGGCSD